MHGLSKDLNKPHEITVAISVQVKSRTAKTENYRTAINPTKDVTVQNLQSKYQKVSGPKNSSIISSNKS